MFFHEKGLNPPRFEKVFTSYPIVELIHYQPEFIDAMIDMHHF